MIFRHSIRFSGYWLGLLSWVMLTLASPLANAVAETDAGWMRLCSTYGVQWVAIGDEVDNQSMSQCQCLGDAIPSPLLDISIAVTYRIYQTTLHYVSPYLMSSYRSFQPRSPPPFLV